MSEEIPTQDALISVVMPVYHEALEVLGRAIDSVLGQTHRHLELIAVLDDPAAADTHAYLLERARRDDRVRPVVNARNLGPWGAYARGVGLARGEYIAIQDADDTSSPERLERLLEHLQANPDIDVVGSGLTYVEAQTGRVLLERHYPPSAGDAIRRYSPMAHGTTLRRRGLDDRRGTYSLASDVRRAADYDLWCRWHCAGVRMANIPDVLYRYNQTAANIKALNVRGILADTVRIKRRYAHALRFRPGDWALLGIEAVGSRLPARIVVAAFYLINRWRSLGLVSSPDRDTRSRAYASRLGVSQRGWRKRLGVQAPYRWHIRHLRPGRVLDVGCGVGRNLAHLDGNGVGVDHNVFALAEARANGLTAMTPDEFARSEWRHDGAFDSILITHVLEHLDEPTDRDLLARYLPNLRSDGRVIAIVPQQAGFASDPTHVRYLTGRDLAQLLEASGLRVERAYSFPFPALVGRVFRYNETVVIARKP